MAVLALITRHDQIEHVVPWARAFAAALGSRVTYLCWAYTRYAQWDAAQSSCASLINGVRECLAELQDDVVPSNGEEVVDIRVVLHPNAAKAAAEMAARDKFQLLVGAADVDSADDKSRLETSALMRYSSCNTVVLYGGDGRSTVARRVLAGSNGGSHDAEALYLASKVARLNDQSVLLGRIERDFGEVGTEVGLRDLRRLIREVGSENVGAADCHVFSTDEKEEIAAALNKVDLVMVGANSRHLPTMLAQTSNPMFASIKRASTLRYFWRRAQPTRWHSGLSKSDYADLYDGLRCGSYLSVDFLVMLGLAAVVASMGLLQDSPAVVIGSMLLAPLMTPMLGCGLALAQANPTLGNRALLSVATGLCGTLVVSAFIGWLTPGLDLTPQVIARASPTALDFLVAVASAAAAAYALARPNLVGSIAGVAIATALVPPLCSAGLALAYQEFVIARGAALLFGTNFVAIVLSAAVTFRVIGVRAGVFHSRHRVWVRRIGAVMTISAVLISIPLHIALQRSVLQGKPQPSTYPLPSSVVEQLNAFADRHPGVDVVSAGRPSSTVDGTDVILFLGAPRGVDSSFSGELVDIIRTEMNDDSLVVEIHCIEEMWQKRFD